MVGRVSLDRRIGAIEARLLIPKWLMMFMSLCMGWLSRLNQEAKPDFSSTFIGALPRCIDLNFQNWVSIGCLELRKVKRPSSRLT
jgi:hypothetical protein